MSVETCLATLTQYYDEHPEIAANKRPNLIHVGGSYCIARTGPSGGKTRDGSEIAPYTYHPMIEKRDVWALVHSVQEMQKIALAARHLLTKYDQLLDEMPL